MDKFCRAVIKIALDEDLGNGDLTSNLTIPANLIGKAMVVAKSPGILSGSQAFDYVYQLLDRKVLVSFHVSNGQRISKGVRIATITGPARSLLAGERVALNLLCHLSGIATLTSRYVSRVGSKSTKILDTRKTTPGLRWLEKKAVVDGGGTNHRMGLYDMILIKDNHIAAAGGISQALERVKGVKSKVEIEIGDLAGLIEALSYKPDIVMLDNFALSDIRKAVRLIRRTSPKTKIEVSGGVTLETIGKIARCGVDYISVGALTHSAPIVDFSMEYYGKLSGRKRRSGR